ncbi:MAG TPA: amidohydrolase family protein [Chloroflexota bacterium]|nr:amidohydrolase family protein [Chloroflexota bacterium]
MAGDGVGYRANVAVAIDRGRIVALGPAADVCAEFNAERTINADHHVALPGFVDAHMHTAWCLLRGLAQDTRHWMMYGLSPFSAHLAPEAMEAGSQLAILEGHKSGTTTFADFGWSDEIGSLEVGKRADLILVDCDRVTLTLVHASPMRNLVPNLVYAARGDEVDTVIIDGQVVLENGRLLTLDEPAIISTAQRLAAAIGPAAESDFLRVNGPNAQFMRDGRL